MKEVLVTIKVKIDQDVYSDYKDNGFSNKQITQFIANHFNGAKLDSQFVSDFEVEDIKEVKE